MKKYRSGSKDSGVSEVSVVSLRSNNDAGPSYVFIDSNINRKPSIPLIPYEANFENMLSWTGPFAKTARVIVVSESNPTSKYIIQALYLN